MEADLSARGIYVPTVCWILQTDYNENVKTYIHRVGRTARLLLHNIIYFYNSDVQMKINLFFFLKENKNDWEFKKKKIQFQKHS